MDRLNEYRKLFSDLRDLAREHNVVFVTATQLHTPRRFIPACEVAESRAFVRSGDIVIVDYADKIEVPR